MPLSQDQRHAEQGAALADAALASDRVRFYPVIPAGHLGAVWFRPSTHIWADEQFPDNALAAEANLPANRDLHRIAVPVVADSAPTFAALVRHELEHARQWDALGASIFDLQDVLEGPAGVLLEVAGGLDGCAGAVINAIPTEIDCNAAASVYITGRFTPDEVQAVRDDRLRRPLACSLVGPPPHETLPARMVAFTYIYRDAAALHSKRKGRPLNEILDNAYPGASAVWSQLDQWRPSRP